VAAKPATRPFGSRHHVLHLQRYQSDHAILYDIDKMKKNAEGGVTIYVGPKALEANWMPTAGKRPLPAMRLYGPTDALNQKTFKIRISRSSTDASLSALAQLT
jgi:hypothetical protein